MRSPTQRSLKWLRDRGWTAQVVEYWNAYARRRIDLFGIIDIVAVNIGTTLGVQTTTGGNLPTRIAKAKDEPATFAWLRGGNRLEFHGWRKLVVKRGAKAKRWKLRRIELFKDGNTTELGELDGDEAEPYTVHGKIIEASDATN